MVIIVISLVLAYMLGNLSPATILARAQGIDIKTAGSGNAGTTNAFRVLGKRAGIITGVVDILKGTVAVLIGNALCGHIVAGFCVLAAFLGHVWPVVFRFKGGKGVAVAFGGLLAYQWILALACFVLVATVALSTKRMSAGSITGAIACPIIAMVVEPDFVAIGTIMALIMLYKHRGNIVRLVKGEERAMSIFRNTNK